jgi:hypothetical protein
MRKAMVLIAVASLLALCCTWALSLPMEHSYRPINPQPGWPEGLADLLLSQQEVYGYLDFHYVNFQDYHYYAGDAGAFNEFVERYSKLKDTPLTLILHCGRGMTGGFDVPDKTTIPADWRVAISPTITPGGAIDGRASIRIVVTLELWGGGQVRLDDAKVPSNVEVKAGPEIEQVEKFTADREAARAKTGP